MPPASPLLQGDLSQPQGCVQPSALWARGTHLPGDLPQGCSTPVGKEDSLVSSLNLPNPV